MAKKSLYALTLSCFVLFCCSGFGAAEEINKSFHQTFNVKPGDSLSLRFGDGNVTLVPWDKDIIDVSVRYRADIRVAGIRLGGRTDFDVEFRQSANTVYVIGKEPSGGVIGFYYENVYEYVYEVHSPSYVRLDLEGDDGDVMIEGWAAEVECRIDDGDVHLRNIAGGRTTVRADDGEVTIDNLSGDLTVAVDDGDVTMTGCDLESCRLDGDDGEVKIHQSKGSFDITMDDGNIVLGKIEAQGLNVTTDDGDIEAGLLTGPTLDADLKTDDGDIEIDLEKGFSVSFDVSADEADQVRLDLTGIEGYKEDRYGKTGSINDGKGRLKIRTADGDVTIREKL